MPKRITKKIHVLDTSALMHSLNALKTYENIVLPITVLDELDHNKKRGDEIGAIVRSTIRLLDGLQEIGSIAHGVKADWGTMIRIEMNHRESAGSVNAGLDLSVPDNRILAVAFNLQQEEEKKKSGIAIVVVSRDINMRVKASALGLEVERFDTEGPTVDDLYTGLKKIEVPTGVIASLRENRHDQSYCENLKPNQFIRFIDEGNPKISLFFRYDVFTKKKLVPLSNENEIPYKGFVFKNSEQWMAMELLLNPMIELVTLVGKAGSGKTFLALAAGLRMVLDKQFYEKMLVLRPIVPMGKDVGYLPGDLENKLLPWMQPVYDNLTCLLRKGHDPKDGTLEAVINKVVSSNVDLGAITYLRGRSIPKQFIIIDEAQNLTPHEVKTIISRAGEDTKIVLTGDPTQIDNPYVDSRSNGLVYAIERMTHREITGHITLQKSVRSELAAAAAEDL